MDCPLTPLRPGGRQTEHYAITVALRPLAACPLLSMALLLTGCLFPIPLVERNEDNHRPAVDVTTVDPTPSKTVHLDRGQAGNREFLVLYVEDTDVSDKLYVRWFVGQDEPDTFVADDEIGDRTAERTLTDWRYDFDPCARRVTVGLPVGERTGVVEAFVTDRPFRAGTVDFRTVPEDALVDSVLWRLELDGECL